MTDPSPRDQPDAPTSDSGTTPAVPQEATHTSPEAPPARVAPPATGQVHGIDTTPTALNPPADLVVSAATCSECDKPIESTGEQGVEALCDQCRDAAAGLATWPRDEILVDLGFQGDGSWDSDGRISASARARLERLAAWPVVSENACTRFGHAYFNKDTWNRLLTWLEAHDAVERSLYPGDLYGIPLVEVGRMLRDGGTTAATGQGEATPTAPSPDALLAVTRLYTNGVSDECIKKVALLRDNSNLSVNEKLTKIDALLPLPPTASAEKLGQMLGVTRQAVLQTDWWVDNRWGKRDDKISEREEAHRRRAQSYEAPGQDDDDGG
jgi:hypothetical protein